MPTALTVAGLVLDMLGAMLLWRFGLPPQIDPQGRDFIITSTVNDDEVRQGGSYRRLSHLGIGLLIAGFGLQAIGALWP